MSGTSRWHRTRRAIRRSHIDELRVTPESIAAAKAETARAREVLYRLTGVRVDADGHVRFEEPPELPGAGKEEDESS